MPLAEVAVNAPAWSWVPPHDSTAGGDAADLAESCGLSCDPEQRLVLDAMLAERAGRWAAFEAAVVCGRQNIKTWTLEVAALHDLVLRRVGRVVWTAHRYKTTQDSFGALAALFENVDFLRRRVHKVSLAAGEQGIQLLPRHTGPRIDFLARAGGASGRGMSGDTVVIDEALYAAPMMMGALVPTLSAMPDPQVRYGSSAGLPSSEVLRAIRDRGRAGGDPSLCYVEWGAPAGGCAAEKCDHRLGTEGCALDDEVSWRVANPALGRRISVEYVRNERRALPPAEFARERLGWWEDPAPAGEVDVSAWLALGDPGAAPGDPVALAVDVSPWHRSAAIVACGPAADGVPVVELVAHRAGSSWLPQAVALAQAAQGGAAVGLDPSGPAGALLPELERAGVRLDLLDSRRSAQACGAFEESVSSGRLRHRDERPLTDALLGASRRPVGDAWKWSRRDSDVDIAPLVAATIARQLWAERGSPDYAVDESIY